MLQAADYLGGQHEGDKLLLFQLPHSFPFTPPAADAAEGEGRGAGADDAGDGGGTHPVNPFANVPAGRLGKLRMHKSGKVSLMLGSVPFTVSEAAHSNVLHQVYAYTSIQICM